MNRKIRTWVEISLNDLEHNYREISSRLPDGCQMLGVCKANAYGHGDYEILTHLEKNGVKAFAVATIEEGIRGMILILGYTDIHRAKELKQYAHLKQLWAAELS